MKNDKNKLILPENTLGNDYIVGDIHGCFTLLESELKNLNFDETIDRLISVGDLVDRGLESEKCLEWLSKDWFYSVLGNHELMAIMYYCNEYDYRSYCRNGGEWFTKLSLDQQKEYVNAFNELPIVIEFTKNDMKYGVVHAACHYSDWNLLTENSLTEFRLVDKCVWDRDLINYQTIIGNIDMVFHGHTPMQDHRIIGNRHYIDTGAVYDGKLTIIKI